MLFAVPSKGRAGCVKTTNILPFAVLYVPQNEVGIYQKTNPKQKIIGVPLGVRGITPTRNWILNNTDDARVVMVDDDVQAQGWVKMFSHDCRHKKLSGVDWVGVCKKLFDCCDDLGWKIWGVATLSAPRAVYPWKPFLSRSYITASFMGLVNDGEMLFDEDFVVKEDYEIGLRHVKKYGGVLCARHVYWQNSHWDDEGGCKDYRNGIVELQAIKKLKNLYPGMIRKVTRGGSGYSISVDF